MSSSTVDPELLVSRSTDNATECLHLSFAALDKLTEFLQSDLHKSFALVPGKPRKLPKNCKASQLAFVDIGRYCGVIEYSQPDQVITVQAGMTYEALRQTLSSAGQWWPVSVHDESMTIGEIIDSGQGGCLEHGFGGPRNLVLGLTVALNSGQIINCGGKVVKNVTGYDLPKLFIGSRGSLGIVLAAHLRLFAHSECETTYLWQTDDLKNLLEASQQLESSGLPLSCLELMDCRLFQQSKNPDLSLLSGSIRQQGSSALVIQAHGYKQVVSEIVERACALVETRLGDGRVVAPESSPLLWRALADVSTSTGLKSVGLVLEGEKHLNLLSQGLKGRLPLWQARPGCGKVEFFTDDVASLMDSLKGFAQGTDQNITVCLADDELEYNVKTLPQQDTVVDSLKTALKERFDPGNRLNPLVSL